MIVFSIILMSVISFLLITTLLKAWFDPRYAELKAKREVIELSIKVDSMIVEVGRKDLFILNIQNILSGQTQKYGLVTETDGGGNVDRKEMEKTPLVNAIDAQFRQEFERNKGEVEAPTYTSINSLEDFYLFKPIDGVVSDKFNPLKDHFGLDIVARDDEPVKSVADGTVIFASWTQDSGYIIALQHRNNLISMYKHNSDLTKSVGNFVRAGEVISIIGNTGELTSGPHLHFELWYNGSPVDPQDFIRF